MEITSPQKALVHLVGPVDGHVQVAVGVQGGQGDAQALSLLLGSDRGGNGDDVLELSWVAV